MALVRYDGARHVIMDDGKVSLHRNEYTGTVAVGPSKCLALGDMAMSKVEGRDDWPEMLHHCIALGEGAVATRPYQLALRVRLRGDPVQLETIMTAEEYEVVSRVVRRLIEHPATPPLPQES